MAGRDLIQDAFDQAMRDELMANVCERRYREGIEIAARRYLKMWNEWISSANAAAVPAEIMQRAGDMSVFIDLLLVHIWIDPYPVPKLRGWLGSIQGKFHMLGITTDEVERDFTRPLFRPLDFVK